MYIKQWQPAPSTTWVPRIDKMRASPDKGNGRASAASTYKVRRRRPEYRFEPKEITVQYRGGPEAAWLLSFGGQHLRVPGHVCLHDALAQAMSWSIL